MTPILRFRRWVDQHPRVVFLAILISLTVCGIAIVWINANGQAERRATFIAQCHDAGYSDAKCLFFLTLSELTGGTIAMQVAISDAAVMPK